MIRKSLKQRQRPAKQRAADPLPIGAAPTKYEHETFSHFDMREIHHSNKRERLEQDRASLTSAEIDHRLVKLLIECGKQAREVTEADIRGQNIPIKEITPARKERCLRIAEQELPELRDRIYAMAA
jgi:hypothetical protein